MERVSVQFFGAAVQSAAVCFKRMPRAELYDFGCCKRPVFLCLDGGQLCAKFCNQIGVSD